MSGVSFSQFSLKLEAGDRLVILSDGVTECPDERGQFLGEVGLEKLLLDLRDVKGPAMLEALIWQLSEFAGQADFPDDISGISFEFQPDTMPK